MKQDTSIFFIGIFTGIVGLGALLICFDLTPKAERQKWEKEIVKRGYGEYVVNVETREVQFVWKK